MINIPLLITIFNDVVGIVKVVYLNDKDKETYEASRFILALAGVKFE